MRASGVFAMGGAMVGVARAARELSAWLGGVVLGDWDGMVIGAGDGAGDVDTEGPCIARARQLFTCSARTFSQFSKFREGSSLWQIQHSSSSLITGRGVGRGRLEGV